MAASAVVLNGDFSLVPVDERLQWRDALSRHLLERMRAVGGCRLPRWKVDEQVVPMNLWIEGLVGQDVTEPQAIERYLDAEVKH